MEIEVLPRRELLWRVGPFAAVVVLALGLCATSPHARTSGLWLVLGAAALFVIVPAAIVLVPWERLGKVAPLIPVVGYFIAVGLLRQGVGGGAVGYGPLVLLPVIWEALYGTRAELACTVGLGALTFVIPTVVLGAPDYGVEQWRLALMYTATGAIVGGVIHGLVNERHQLVERLQHQALHDDLTGLPNRRACEELLDQAVEGLDDRWLSFIDLDRFKRFNDSHGHASGDRVLRLASAAWQEAVGPDAFLGRWGGEEFLLLYRGPIDDAEAVLAAMAQATPENQTFSAGVVQLGLPDCSWTEALAAADLALYRAKNKGRNRVEIVGQDTEPEPEPETRREAQPVGVRSGHD